MSRRAAAVKSAALFLLIAIPVIRAPRIFSGLRFFAEESTYFLHAYHLSWTEALLETHLGYFSLLVNVGATLGAHFVPLEYAPLPDIVLGLSCHVLIAALVMLPGSPFDRPAAQLAAIFLIVFGVPSAGRFDLPYVHFYLAAATGIILISHSPTTGLQGARLAALVVAGLTGVVSLALTPLYWIAAWKSRSPERTRQALLLTGCGVLHSLFLVFGSDVSSPDRFVAIEIEVMLAAAAVKSVAMPLFGWGAMVATGTSATEAIGADGSWLAYVTTLVIAVVACAALVAVMIRVRPDCERWYLDPCNLMLLSYWILVAFAFVFGVTWDGNRQPYLLKEHRYFAAPNAFVAIAIVLHASRLRGLGALFHRGLTVWLLVGAMLFYCFQAPRPWFHGPSWKQEVARWREDPTYQLRVWPWFWERLPLAPRQPEH